MSEYKDKILELANNYAEDCDKFFDKGTKAAAVRARKALLEISKITKLARKEILDKRKADEAAK